MSMDQFTKMFQEAMAAVEWPAGLSDEEIHSLVQEKILEGVGLLSAEVYTSLTNDAPDMLKEERAQAVAFERRNRGRWKKPLDLLKIMVRVVQESGEGLCQEWAVEPDNREQLFSALNRLFVKALVITREAICLMEAGFADGALARWRSLHEVAVIASFLSKFGEQAAARYIASFTFASRSAMKNINEYAHRAGMKQYSAKELSAADDRCNELDSLFGKGIDKDYGWARDALGVAHDARVTFFSIEQAVALDHWRPRYRWASQNVHSNYSPPRSSLGMVEAKEEIHLVGPSNSGMVDPLHMTAISLGIVASAFLSTWPNMDRLVVLNFLSRISEEIGPVALEVEAKSARRAAVHRGIASPK